MYQDTLPGCTNLVHWLHDVPYNYTCLALLLLLVLLFLLPLRLGCPDEPGGGSLFFFRVGWGLFRTRPNSEMPCREDLPLPGYRRPWCSDHPP